MAIYHYHRELGKRTNTDGKVRNAVFAAAYIRGEERTCERTGEIKDFTKKSFEVIYKECILSEGAPQWAQALRHSQVKDPTTGEYGFDTTGVNFSEVAWNRIENIEKRHDSQIYFHDDFAIPIELSQEAAIELVREFVKTELAINGLFCDVSIHWESENPHAHVLMPCFRTLTEEGFSKKLRLSRQELSAEVVRVRTAWSEHANRKLQEYGIDARIDHRSFEERGIALTPTVKIGKAKHMSDTEHQELRIAQNQLIRAKNFDAIQANPNILAQKIAQDYQQPTSADVRDELAKYVVGAEVLAHITHEDQQHLSQEKLVRDIVEILKRDQAVFSERELKSTVLKKTANRDDFEQIIHAVHESHELIQLGLGDDGREHYVTKAVFEMETELSRLTDKLSNRFNYLVMDHTIKQVAAEFNLNDSQKQALKHITQAGDLSIVMGVAGSGKTYMLKAAREVWSRSGYRVHGVAFSGRAAAGLEAESGIKSHTIDRFLKSVQYGAIKISKGDIIVMDEMGMTSLDDMHRLVKVAHAGSCAFKGVGDIEQTQPVGRGAPMRAMIEQTGFVTMNTILRQKRDWQREATLHMETQQTGQGLDAYFEQGCVEFFDKPMEAKNHLVSTWFKHIQENHLSTSQLREAILISHKNDTVMMLNKSAREKLIENGVLNNGEPIATDKGQLLIARGERILFTKNDYALQVKNGDFGTITNINNDILEVRLDNDKQIQFATTGYNHIAYGYAATIHKLQGATCDNAFLYVDGRGWNRHVMLVAASRHRNNLIITADRETFVNYQDLKTSVSRGGLKDHSFDYPVSFSLRRGFDENKITQQAAQLIRKTKDKLQDSWLWLTNYQEYIAKQNGDIEATDPHAELKQRRLEAVTVADFCDNQIMIAKAIQVSQGMAAMTEDQKAAQSRAMYELQLKSYKFAKIIHANPERFTLALEKNRINYTAIEKSVAFGQRHELVAASYKCFTQKAMLDLNDSHTIMSDLRRYYPNLMFTILDKTDRNRFIRVLKQKELEFQYRAKQQEQKTQKEQTTHPDNSELYYHKAEPLAYTKGEHYLREVKGLIGVDLFELRFDRDKNAIIIPAVNANHEIQAEVLFYLDDIGNKVINVEQHGNTEGCAIRVQQPAQPTSLYITDDFMDAKAIQIGSPTASIYVSLNQFRDLKDIDWILDQNPKQKSVNLTVESFDKSTQQRITALAQGLRDKHKAIVMAKGRLEGDYTHVSIHAALLRQEKMRGDGFITHCGIKEDSHKHTFKDKIAQAFKAKEVPAQALPIKRPEALPALKYYVELPHDKKEVLQTYFNALDQLKKQDNYESALSVAKSTVAVYEKLFDEVQAIYRHPQPLLGIESTCSQDLIRHRVEQGKVIGLHELRALFKEIEQPKLDSHTQTELSTIRDKMVAMNYDKDYGKQISKFSREKSELIKAYQDEHIISVESYNHTVQGIDVLAKDPLNRHAFLEITQHIERDATTQTKSYQKQKKQERDQDRDGRGY